MQFSQWAVGGVESVVVPRDYLVLTQLIKQINSLFPISINDELLYKSHEAAKWPSGVKSCRHKICVKQI